MTVGGVVTAVLRQFFAILRLEPHLGPMLLVYPSLWILTTMLLLARLLPGLSMTENTSAAHPDRSPLGRRLIGRIVGLVIVVGAVATSVAVWRLTDIYPRTDDAAVRANIVGIAPHVSGPIVELHVVDNQRVRAGDLLFVVDARPYEARLERASAELLLTRKEVEAQERAIGAAVVEIGRREAGLAVADAQLLAARDGAGSRGCGNCAP